MLVLLALVVPGCVKLNAAFGAGGGTDGATGTGSTTATTASSDTKASSGSGPSTTSSPGSTAGTTHDPPTTTHHGDTTAGDDDGSTTDPSVGTVGMTGDPVSCPSVLGPCDAYADDPCALGECRPYGVDGDFGGVGCVEQAPAKMPLEPGAGCSHTCPDAWGQDACPDRSICDPFADNPRCVRLCGGDGPGYTCPGLQECEVHDVPGGSFGICRPQCSLLEQDCDGDQACIVDGKTGEPVCVPGGVGEEGDPCAFVNECSAGLVCLTDSVVGCSGGSACCTSLCDLDEDIDECPGPLECQPYGAGVGACQLPG